MAVHSILELNIDLLQKFHPDEFLVFTAQKKNLHYFVLPTNAKLPPTMSRILLSFAMFKENK